MCKAIDDIRRIINDSDLQLSWLAQQLGGRWTKHRLYYLLNSGKDISVTDYTELMRFFDRHGFLTQLTAPECTTALEEVARLNTESAALVALTVESTQDNELTTEEKQDIILKLQKIERRIAELKEVLK